ncbi:esterase family protein [Enterovibrio sp. ZSDZ35]|uniref:Esterase family protein n=1 Tax=Enterovibrio qingdaonensis TaxID=2899818 RepID=A0ABT5QJL0_9GAMM|nr:alpha/beta fold hydrolase [Enterovibrio sp. ZSDZ35]MDD1781175.1 esterase family protein [Enterovibrio sp. ZSDZ35]
MRKVVVLCFMVFSFFVSALSYANTSRTQYIKIDAPALENNLLETPTEQFIYVALPPSYFTSEKRYPVVYYLHGFQGVPLEARVLSGTKLDKYSAENDIQEMIIVGINGANQFGGSFFVNSPVTGNWEDFVTTDVLSYIDSTFRTLDSAHHRGIVGFSMGGFAAVNIAFRHPDKFKHVFSLSPGLFDQNGLQSAVTQWREQGWLPVFDAYGAAFAPNPHSNTGTMWYEWDSTDPTVVEKWESGYGDIDEKVAAYLKQEEKLTSIYVEYGSEDEFKWIPDGSRYLVKTLKEKGIEVSEHDHGSGHVITFRQAEHIIDFFGKAF